LSNKLEAINQDFEKKFHFFFQEPALIQVSLKQRSKEKKSEIFSQNLD